MYELKMYVIGLTGRITTSIEELKAALEEIPGLEYSFEVVNILENPQAAIKNGVFATPTIIRHSPEPTKRVINGLADIDRLIRELELYPVNSQQLTSD